MPIEEPLQIDPTKPDRQQLTVQPPIISSHAVQWQGLNFAYHRQPTHELPEYCFAQHTITICTGTFEISCHRQGQWHREYYTNGDVSLLPAYQSSPQTRCDRGAEFIHLYLEPKIFAQVAYESVDADRVELVAQAKIRDPLIQQIGLALKTELELGSVDSRLYAESMATALSAHLLQRYSTKHLALRDYTGGLPKHKLRQAIAYIHEHLDQDLRLSVIAAVVQMSSHYFATLFKQSTGLSPHQYIMRHRIERAKALLNQPDLTIVEISQQVGFKNQSHFTRMFRQYMGCTPKTYRGR